jgi:hypothetical protein
MSHPRHIAAEAMRRAYFSPHLSLSSFFRSLIHALNS